MGSVNVQKRGKVYQYQFEIAPVKGKRKFINKSGFRTKAEAIEAGTQAYTEYQNAGVPFKEQKISYSDYLDYWLNNYCKTNLKYNTIQAYETLIKKYIKPYIGKYRLSTITSVRLNTFITELCDEYDFSRAYFKSILKVVKGSFRDACDLYGFLKYNPAITLRLPRLDKEKEDIKHLYSQEEIDTILNRFKDNETFTCAFLTSCYTGMRTGEVFALTWEDIDLENGTISIKHNVYDKPKDEKGRWFIGSTKTFAGKRIIHISETLLNALKNYQKKQQLYQKLYGKKYKEKINLVFTKENGLYVGTDLTRYPFKIIHNKLGIEKCRFYDLRGSYATKILTNGIEIRDVADILGHRNVETTENYYISSTEKSRRLATDVFDKITKSEIIEEIIKYE